MLAKRRAILSNGEIVARTPLLVPSFSSKGFPEVRDIIDYSSEVIDGPMLVSAYDLYHSKISPPFEFPSLIFLDSGGYEASKDLDLSDLGDSEHKPLGWTQEMHERVLSGWKSSQHTVFISYDHPKDRLTIADQIERARKIAEGEDVLREILLKPETEGQRYLHMDNVLQNIHSLAGFAVIGVTEKEVGNSISDRMRNIAKLRLGLNKAGLDTPIHVFGSLDTVTTPMYFLAGADIFDGLTWLRFAYFNGLTIYKHNFGALDLPLSSKSHQVDARCWNGNYYYLKEMELEMKRFLQAGKFNAFKFHSDMLEKAHQNLIEELEV